MRLQMWRASGLVLIAAALAGCGGGGGSGSSATSGGAENPAAVVPASNTLELTVERGFDNGSTWYPNQPFVSIQVCQPDLSKCVTIDKVLVDTGSFGLRIFDTALAGITPTGVTHQGGELRQCAGFGSGYTLGRIVRIGLKMAGTQARDLPIQLIDSSAGTAPSGCAAMGSAQFTNKEQVGGNAILGIGPLGSDASSSLRVRYFTQVANQTNLLATVPENIAVPNPVTRLDQHNNGLVLQFPPVGLAGETTLKGTMTLGLNTANNNATSGVKFFGVSDAARLRITLAGRSYNGLIDSGSNYYHFPSRYMAPCEGTIFFCPSKPETVPITIQSWDLASSLTSELLIDDYRNYNGMAAQPGLAGYDSGATELVLGLPYFYGRKVYVAIQGKGTASVPAPAIGL